MGVLVSFCALQVQAACTYFDGFIDNKDGTVTDPRNGLLWKRCSEGFEWVNSVCVGEAKIVNWFEAMKAARESRYLDINTWRLPSIGEIKAITGTWENCQNNSSENQQYAASSMLAHPNMTYKNTPKITSFWTSTRHEKNAMLGNMSNGSHDELPADIKEGLGLSFRLVASKKSAKPSEFEKNYDSKTIHSKNLEAQAYKDRISKEKNEQAKREAAERSANVCNSIYPGKTGTRAGPSSLSIAVNYVVRYVNKDRGTATIEATNSGQLNMNKLFPLNYLPNIFRKLNEVY